MLNEANTKRGSVSLRRGKLHISSVTSNNHRLRSDNDFPVKVVLQSVHFQERWWMGEVNCPSGAPQRLTEFTPLMTRIKFVITPFEGAELLIHLVTMTDVSETSCQGLIIFLSRATFYGPISSTIKHVALLFSYDEQVEQRPISEIDIIKTTFGRLAMMALSGDLLSVTSFMIFTTWILRNLWTNCFQCLSNICDLFSMNRPIQDSVPGAYNPTVKIVIPILVLLKNCRQAI